MQISGQVYVVGDNIDTDQIIPAEYLTLVPSKPEEYAQLGSYALCGLLGEYPPFVEAGSMTTKFPVILAGRNFGCGSSREHAPIALGAAGVEAVVAPSFARIFFRNCTATGEVYPCESCEDLVAHFTTGQDVTLDLVQNVIHNHTTGQSYPLKPLGDVAPVIQAGGIFAYAREMGMIRS